MNNEFHEYTDLKEKLELEKKRIAETEELGEKKMEDKSNRLKVM